MGYQKTALPLFIFHDAPVSHDIVNGLGDRAGNIVRLGRQVTEFLDIRRGIGGHDRKARCLQQLPVVIIISHTDQPVSGNTQQIAQPLYASALSALQRQHLVEHAIAPY